MAEARFAGMLEYLQALKQSKLKSGKKESVDKLFQACVLDIQSAPPISMETGAKLLRQLSQAGIGEEWEQQLAELVEEKVAAEPVEDGKKKDPKTQHCQNLQNYFLENEWKALLEEKPLLQKVSLIAKRMAMIGLKSPNEPTAVAGVAIAFLASHKGPAEDLQWNAVKALSTLHDLKMVVRAQRAYDMSNMKRYPHDPAELPEDLLRRAYGTEKPVACPLDAAGLLFLRKALPARDTHASVRGCFGKPRGRASKALEMAESMMAFMPRLPQMLANFAGADHEELPLTMFSRQKAEEG